MITVAHLLSLSLLVFGNSLLLGMDPEYPQLQLNELRPKCIIHGKLFIDHLKNESDYLDHVEYLTNESRQKYSCTEKFKNVPLHVPFIHVIIAPNEDFPPKIHTIIPAHLLINHNNGSIIEFPTKERVTFSLTCAKNKKLFIDQQNTFETQFITCMDQFYKKRHFCLKGDQTNYQQLAQNNILQIEGFAVGGGLETLRLFIADPGFFSINLLNLLITLIYAHGPQSCSTPEKLESLAIEPTIKPYGNNTFSYVMNRSQGKPSRKLQTNPIEANYLKNIKNVGNKKPMSKTIHFPKSPSTDIVSKSIKADTISLKENLDSLLENCLKEMKTKEESEERIMNEILETSFEDFMLQENILQTTYAIPCDKNNRTIENECVIL